MVLLGLRCLSVTPKGEVLMVGIVGLSSGVKSGLGTGGFIPAYNRILLKGKEERKERARKGLGHFGVLLKEPGKEVSRRPGVKSDSSVFPIMAAPWWSSDHFT